MGTETKITHRYYITQLFYSRYTIYVIQIMVEKQWVKS